MSDGRKQEPDGGEVERSLSATALLAGAGPASLADLAAIASRRSWTAGQTIFQRGDDGDYMLVLTGGQVRLSVSSAEGKELVLGHLGPGDILGEFSLIDGKPRSADATATGPTTALMLHRDGFLRAVSAHADLGLALARHLCAQLRSTNYQMESIALHELRARVARFLLMTLHARHGADLPPEAELQLGFSQSELAAVLGASRPKVNRVLQMMMADGVLRRAGSGLICDTSGLDEMLGDDAVSGLV